MNNDDFFKEKIKDIDNNKMYPEDWEDIIFSDFYTDEEVLYFIMYARRKNRIFRNGRYE